MIASRKWRKERVSNTWRLVAGRGADRVRLTLGTISEEEAEQAREAMQRAEDDGRGPQLLALAEQDRDAAVGVLLRGADDDVFGDLPVDHGAMRLDDYVRDVWTPHRSEKRPASWRSERGFWAKINAALGRYRLRELASPTGSNVIDDYLVGMQLDDGRPASIATRRLHRAALRALLTHARRKNHIKAIPEFFRLETNAENPGRGPSEVLTADERRRLIEAEPDLRLRALWTVATHLGCRPSENCRMDWADVDWDAEGKGYQGAIFITGTKTEQSKALVPMVGPVRAVLQEWWIKCGRPTEGVIFPSGAHGAPDRPFAATDTSYKKSLRSACKRAGITKKITPYSLRHTCATIAKQAGMQTGSIAKLLRHSNPRMVEQRYDHSGALDVPDLDLLAER